MVTHGSSFRGTFGKAPASKCPEIPARLITVVLSSCLLEIANFSLWQEFCRWALHTRQIGRENRFSCLGHPIRYLSESLGPRWAHHGKWGTVNTQALREPRWLGSWGNICPKPVSGERFLTFSAPLESLDGVSRHSLVTTPTTASEHVVKPRPPVLPANPELHDPRQNERGHGVRKGQVTPWPQHSLRFQGLGFTLGKRSDVSSSCSPICPDNPAATLVPGLLKLLLGQQIIVCSNQDHSGSSLHVHIIDFQHQVYGSHLFPDLLLFLLHPLPQFIDSFVHCLTFKIPMFIRCPCLWASSVMSCLPHLTIFSIFPWLLIHLGDFLILISGFYLSR